MGDEKRLVGKVTHYFGKINVAGIELSDTVKVGDILSIEGSTTSFEQQIDSMQIDNDPVDKATTGNLIGIKVKDRVRAGDKVYLVR